MTVVEHGDAQLSYIERGSGPAVLVLAPGGMRSAHQLWSVAPWNPIDHLAGTHRVIAMDQRNAGSSTAPVTGTENWATYTADQLAVLDHLGIDRFAVVGMCIGGPFVLGLLKAAPERVTAAVAMQPTGLEGDNREAFQKSFDSWAVEEAPRHPEAGPAEWAAYREGMFGVENTLFSVAEADLPGITTPLLVLQGDDLHHPRSASRLLASSVPGATLIERWKEPDDQPAARDAVGRFLAEH